MVSYKTTVQIYWIFSEIGLSDLADSRCHNLTVNPTKKKKK